jgi:hypothetical protein
MLVSMLAIMMESVLFVAAIAAVATLLFLALKAYTPLGMHLRQRENRRQIEREAENVCPVHGPHEQHELVRLASGERICPDCFREAVQGSLG